MNSENLLAYRWDKPRGLRSDAKNRKAEFVFRRNNVMRRAGFFIVFAAIFILGTPVSSAEGSDIEKQAADLEQKENWAAAEPLRRDLLASAQNKATDEEALELAQIALAHNLVHSEHREALPEAETLLRGAIMPLVHSLGTGDTRIRQASCDLGLIIADRLDSIPRGGERGAIVAVADALCTFPPVGRLPTEEDLSEYRRLGGEFDELAAPDKTDAKSAERRLSLLHDEIGLEESVLGPSHPRLASTLAALAFTRQPIDQGGEADLRRAVDITTKALGSGDDHTVRAVLALIRFLQMTSKWNLINVEGARIVTADVQRAHDAKAAYDRSPTVEAKMALATAAQRLNDDILLFAASDKLSQLMLYTPSTADFKIEELELNVAAQIIVQMTSGTLPITHARAAAFTSLVSSVEATPQGQAQLQLLAQESEARLDHADAFVAQLRRVEILSKISGPNNIATADAACALAYDAAASGNGDFVRFYKDCETKILKVEPITADTAEYLLKEAVGTAGMQIPYEPLFRRRAIEILSQAKGPRAPETVRAIAVQAQYLTYFGHPGDKERGLPGDEAAIRDGLNLAVSVLGPGSPEAIQLSKAIWSSRFGHSTSLPFGVVDFDIADQLGSGPPLIRLPTADEAEAEKDIRSKLDESDEIEGFTQRWALYESILSIERKTWGAAHPVTADTLVEKAKITFTEDELDPAVISQVLSDLREALAAYTKSLGDHDKRTMDTESDIAEFLEARNRYREALEFRQQQMDGLTKAGDLVMVADAEASIGDDWQSLGDLAKAQNSFEAALKILADAKADESETSYYVNKLVNFYRKNKNFGAARPYCEKLLAQAQADYGRDAPETVVPLLDLAANWEGDHRRAEVERYLEQAIAIRARWDGNADPKTLDLKDRLAKLKRGGVAFPADWEKAERNPNSGREAREDIGIGAHARKKQALPPGTPEAVLKEQLARFAWDDAVATLDGMIAKAPAGEAQLGLLTRKADLLEQLGRDEEAETVRERILLDCEKRYGKNDWHVGRALSNLAANLDWQGRAQAAEPMHRRAEALLGGDRNGGEGDARTEYRKSRLRLADNLEGRGQYRQAENLLRSLVSFGGDYEIGVRLLANLRAQGRVADAETQYRAFQNKMFGIGVDRAAYDMEVAALELDLGQPAAAESPARQAIGAMQDKLPDAYPEAARAHVLLGRALLEEGLPDQAVPELRTACPVLEANRGRAGASDASEHRIAAAMSECARNLALSLHASNAASSIDEAFAAAQTAQQSAAGEALSRAGAHSAARAAGVAIEAENYERSLDQRAELDREFAAAAGSSTPDAQALRTSISEQRSTVEADIRRLATELGRSPRYWQLRSPEPISIKALQSETGSDSHLLKPDEALVLWMDGGENSHGLVFAVSKDRSSWAEIPLTGKVLRESIARLRIQIDPKDYRLRSATGGGDESTLIKPAQFDRRLAHELYSALLGDPSIQSVIAGKTVLIVPSGPLISLPPSLLVVDAPENGADGPAAWRATHWFIKDHSFVLLPSVASLRILRQSPQTPSWRTSFIGFADPDFSGNNWASGKARVPSRLKRPASLRAADFSIDGLGRLDMIHKLDRLTGTLKEGQELQELLRAPIEDLFVGRAASETSLRELNQDKRLSDTRIILFATHGLVSGNFGLSEPALVLAAPKQVTANDDGLLTASEAMSLQLDADWVILSACNTASPSSSGAQGLSGLARAFFFAGARSLLVSNWRVGDEATRRLITKMISLRRANPGLSKAKALQGSMLALMDDLPSPSAWAPFVVVGDPD